VDWVDNVVGITQPGRTPGRAESDSLIDNRHLPTSLSDLDLDARN
jgi:hypothetical protein